MPEFQLKRVAASPWTKIGGDVRGGREDDTLAAIVKVREPGYVPSAAHRRTAISDTLFTADVRRGRLSELEHDPLVVSVELSRRLHEAG